MDSEVLSDTLFPAIPKAPDVPATIGAETFQDPAVIAALAVDPNHSLNDDVLENIKGILNTNTKTE